MATANLPPVFNLRPPEAEPAPVVVSIPHAGIFVPEDIARDFADGSIRALPMTDWHLQHLYDFLPSLGVTTLYANYSRFVVDLNRPPDATPLYPGRYETGLVATSTFQGEAIYREPPNAAAIEHRRQQFHAPYHEKLSYLLEEHRKQFGRVVLIDAHSIASQANLLHGALQSDVYLGDRDGKSCEARLIDCVCAAFTRARLKVAINDPYKGGYITAHYGAQANTQALQIEMCQRLYMDEADPAIALSLPQFTDMKRVLYEVFSTLLDKI